MKTLIPEFLSQKPWDSCRRLEVVRFSYKHKPAGEVLDRGVNFFVLALEHIGATPVYSCEGHPSGFYVLFQCSYRLAQRISDVGYFTVEIGRRGVAKDWVIRLPYLNQKAKPKTEKDKIFALRLAAAAWQNQLLKIAPPASTPAAIPF